MSKIDVVGFGAMNIDHLYQVERILTDGEAPVKQFSVCPGGSAANTIYGLAKLGVSTGFVGAIGDDDEGKALMRDLARIGVDTSRIKLKRNVKTGSVLCLTDSQGRRALYVSPGANSLLSSEDVDIEYLNQARIVHLSSFVDEQQLVLQRRIVSNLSPGIKVSFAPGAIYAVKGLSAVAPIIGRAHILFLNRDELKQLTHEDLEKGAQQCLEQGCQIVVVTLGKGKMSRSRRAMLVGYVTDGQREHLIKVRQIPEQPAADTTGAGDAFVAGFLYGLLQGKGLQECGYLGDLVARLSITELGARAGLPSLAELSQSYEELYQEPL